MTIKEIAYFKFLGKSIGLNSATVDAAAADLEWDKDTRDAFKKQFKL